MNSSSIKPGDPALAIELSTVLEGEVLFDRYSRGRYSTDASIYQIEPIGVVVPKSIQDVLTTIQFARGKGVPILPRGAGTSQCGQTVGKALVVDFSKYLNRVVSLDKDTRTVKVEPGVVLDQLNQWLKPHGLFFPVDVSTASRATIGGMTGNNSCGARSIRYGNMVHNVVSIDAIMADGEQIKFGDVPAQIETLTGGRSYRELVATLRNLARTEGEELARRFPKLLRRVGGYNLDEVSDLGHNMARLLVGSEGTLTTYTQIELALHPIPKHKVLGVCHFPTFYSAMDATQHIVKLQPAAVELVDRTMIDLSRDIDIYRPIVERFVNGKPEAVLLVEFAGDDLQAEQNSLSQLVELMADLGFPDSVVTAEESAFQADIWEVRKAGLNIMMSMKGDGKPVSFIEDCAVSLEDLAEYTDRLTDVFSKHGTTGTWYAHASVGCLHVRPVLNMKDGTDVKKMRAIAEEAFEMVREYKGSHSGEHGDGLVRSEFHESMFGSRIARVFEKVKDTFDPNGLYNPGKIVRPSKMDDRSLFRYPPDYKTRKFDTALDWSDWHGFAGAVEMCNNNGACRKANPGVMCPSFRATGEEKDLTRGRANTLRLALSGQLGENALTSEQMYQTMDLCVGCKACKRECPTGVDVSRMKTEFLYHYQKANRLSIRDRLVAYLPRYASKAAYLAPLLNLRNLVPGLPWLTEKFVGFSAKKKLPRWRRDYFQHNQSEYIAPIANNDKQVVLLVDTFNTWFEPENARAAIKVLTAAGYEVILPEPIEGRPLCCGRTFLSVGMADEAKREMRRTLDALAPYITRDLPILGLEPSCLFTLKDEITALFPNQQAQDLANRVQLFEEFIVEQQSLGKLELNLNKLSNKRVLLHGHCHQKAFAAMSSVEKTLGLVPGLEVETIPSSCCGMAGAFGYEAEHYSVSMKMAEMDLLPAVRKADVDTIIVADGTSCRHQIQDGADRSAIHVARLLARAI